ncbi:MAG: 2-amino-4-hydroxy-6-hydroxymethyldihydropteridine diphosphokinase [Candidatus Cloacimonetes bacterium 4572_55]|nr:MAG: 2-amino-4-hydroxy-6-hydroxymethyldihydropteridine diphosphokinase [Candidatus Cloacimonetes bacterium 4572_55]
MWTRCIIALGSNLGDKRTNLNYALDRLEETSHIRVETRSSYRETDPVGYVDQPRFLNAAALLSTRLSPVDLLGAMQKIEADMGRQRTVIWGPRTIDLDLLFYGDSVVNTLELVLPHPGIQERLFVLDPLVEIASEWIHPVYKKSVYELRQELIAWIIRHHGNRSADYADYRRL